jgi:hypothetical protein
MVDDLYRWDGSDTNPNQGRPQQPGQPGQPQQPGGRDLYQWDGSRDNRFQPPQVMQPQGNPWQQQWQMEQQQMQMRPRQFWGGRGQGGGDIYVTAMPGSEVIINNAGGDVNTRGGMRYDYNQPGGQLYDYRQYYPRQCQQPTYQQYRGCYNPQQQFMPQQQYNGAATQPVYYPDYYSGGYQGQQMYQPQMRASYQYNDGGSGMRDAQTAFNMALQGFEAFASYDIARRITSHGHHRPQQFFQEQCGYGPRGNYQHGSQRYPRAYQCS